MAGRKIIKIDQEKCNGCALCIPQCHEGAIQIINKKAHLVSDLSCDGLGACIGYCPQGAISIIEVPLPASHGFTTPETGHTMPHSLACPGSGFKQWPIQISLVPPSAPYLDNADLLIAADCVPFIFAPFQKDLLKGKVLLIGCPKLDDTEIYQEKINQILKNNRIKSIVYAHMEVPCCFGLVNIIRQAISQSAKNIPFEEAIISIEGKRLK